MLIPLRSKRVAVCAFMPTAAQTDLQSDKCSISDEVTNFPHRSVHIANLSPGDFEELTDMFYLLTQATDHGESISSGATPRRPAVTVAFQQTHRPTASVCAAPFRIVQSISISQGGASPCSHLPVATGLLDSKQLRAAVQTATGKNPRYAEM